MASETESPSAQTRWAQCGLAVVADGEDAAADEPASEFEFEFEPAAAAGDGADFAAVVDGMASESESPSRTWRVSAPSCWA